MAYSIRPVSAFAVPGTPTPIVRTPEAFKPFSAIRSLTSPSSTPAIAPAVSSLSVAMVFPAVSLHSSSTSPAVMPVPPTSIPISYIASLPHAPPGICRFCILLHCSHILSWPTALPIMRLLPQCRSERDIYLPETIHFPHCLPLSLAPACPRGRPLQTDYHTTSSSVRISKAPNRSRTFPWASASSSPGSSSILQAKTLLTQRGRESLVSPAQPLVS